MTARKPGPRVPFGPLERLARAENRSDLARRLGVDRSVVSRWVREGMTVKAAERMATREGFLPFEVWGHELWDAVSIPRVDGPCAKGHGPEARYVSESGRLVCRRCCRVWAQRRQARARMGVAA